MALMHGGFVGVVADKVFHVHPALLALISAASMFGNLSSFFWARVADGRRKVPLLVALLSGCVTCVAAIALIPISPAGSLLLAASVIACQLLQAGLSSVRGLVWTLNYPRDVRGRVTARLSILTTLTITLISLAAGAALDASPESFRWLYLAGALAAALGVYAFSGVRLIGESEQITLERDARAPTGPEAPAARGMLGVLRADSAFARYQIWQFVLGASNMMIEAPLIYLVSRELQASYIVSIALTQAIPLGLSVVMMPFWAAWLDRVHVLDFRAGHSWLFTGSTLLTWTGALTGSLWLVAAGRVVSGVARGGGSLAWSLGHNDFAAPDRVTLYKGIHVTLTGVSAGSSARSRVSARRSPRSAASARRCSCCPPRSR
jgi:MFS family permease